MRQSGLRIILAVCAIGLQATASPAAIAAGSAAAPLKIITSSSIPPYVIAGENRGMVVEIMRKAFASEGYALEFSYAPNLRAEQELAARRVDGIYNLPCAADSSVFFSEPVVDYRNVVVTLASSKLAVDGVRDLAGKRVVSFQNGPLFLGPEFGDMARANRDYAEVSNQSLEVAMLYGRHADAIVLDERIFMYYYRHSADASKSAEHYVVHPIFPQAHRCAAFVDPRVRDAGNRGLRKLHDSGEYDSIVARYDSAS